MKNRRLLIVGIGALALLVFIGIFAWRGRSENTSSSSREPCDSNPNHNACKKDSQHVYGDVGTVLLGADPKTFVVLGEEGLYGRDTSHVYWMVQAEEGPNPHQIPDADAASFAVIPVIETYAKDKNHVYWEGEVFAPMPDVDPATFVSYSGGCGPSCEYFARDKNHLYKSVGNGNGGGRTVVQ